MKTFLLTTVLAASCAFAQAAAPAAPAAPAELSAEAQALVPFVDEMAACMNQISDRLDSIKDKASADAAAPKLAELFEQLKTIKTKVTEITAKNPNAQLEIQGVASEKLKAPLTRFMQSIANVAVNNGYESEALLEVFTSLQEDSAM